MREFTSALLAKQAWRVCFGLNNVLQSVLRQKYFPQGTFFDSKLGSSPSYTWRSIWGSRDLLVVGLCWKVGDGTSILIMGHPWIPRPVTFQPLCRSLSLPPTTRVSGLLTEDTAWNSELINAEFCKMDTDSILDIKVTTGEGDSLVWHFDKQGVFSVRGAYSVAIRLREEAESSSCAMSWDFLWKSNASPRVLIFTWRCAQDALPITVRLRSRGVQLDEGCGCCGAESEDVLHVLFHCSFARLVWAISDLPLNSIVCSQTTPEAWLREVCRRLDRWDWDYFLTVCWSIWKARNWRLFEGRLLDAQEIIQQAQRVIGGVRAPFVIDQSFSCSTFA
ncbi:UNVERIFIED_CONTAM: hypothetical protein Slati_3870500 [Sesamum latifolium]|uniref:Reverse transcriptase zinc-binding domain-containing protein n=1 Tax=Sesamum latifolium TaxID=2727402 RepID=A0AAW2TPM6_9LAMI